MESFGFPKQYTIPTLDEIVSPDTHLTDCGPYNRGAFVQFLANAHCMENLEFIVELDRFMAKFASISHMLNDDSVREHDRLLHQWHVIHKVFLQPDAVKEVNIPGQLRSNLYGEVLPHTKQVVQIRALIYELLLDLFNEFVSKTRELRNDQTTQRRRLEIVPPELKTIEKWLPDKSEKWVHAEKSTRIEIPRLLVPLCTQWEREMSRNDHDDVGDLAVELPRSRTALAGTILTRASSRGLSIGSIVDNLRDYLGWRTVKKLRFRRASNDQDEREG